MTIFSEFGRKEHRPPLLNVRSFAFEQLVCIHGATFDLRWAMIELAVRSFTAMCTKAQGYFVRRSLHRRQGCLGEPRHC